MSSLAGKLAVVTGASSGIGKGIAERLALNGASVIVNYGKSAGKAKDVVAGIESRGGKAWAVQADMSNVADIRRLFEYAVDQGGSVDIVVTNAGMFWMKPLSDVTEEEFDTMFALNTKGTFFSLQEAARRISDGGRIINISTGATSITFPGGAVYSGSKAAGEQFTKILAKELGARSITVNTVSPGFTDTEMLPQDPEFREMGKNMSPLGRIGHVKDIADVVAFLAGPEGGWITGQNIQAGGGIV